MNIRKHIYDIEAFFSSLLIARLTFTNISSCVLFSSVDRNKMCSMKDVPIYRSTNRYGMIPWNLKLCVDDKTEKYIATKLLHGKFSLSIETNVNINERRILDEWIRIHCDIHSARTCFLCSLEFKSIIFFFCTFMNIVLVDRHCHFSILILTTLIIEQQYINRST
jgi:hypothetical protein